MEGLSLMVGPAQVGLELARGNAGRVQRVENHSHVSERLLRRPLLSSAHSWGQVDKGFSWWYSRWCPAEEAKDVGEYNFSYLTSRQPSLTMRHLRLYPPTGLFSSTDLEKETSDSFSILEPGLSIN